jgi:hypothetical protein
MKWQHWLDPVGQYIEVIVAVKSQFVFAAGTRGGAWMARPAMVARSGTACRALTAMCGAVSLSRKLMTDAKKQKEPAGCRRYEMADEQSGRPRSTATLPIGKIVLLGGGFFA